MRKRPEPAAVRNGSYIQSDESFEEFRVIRCTNGYCYQRQGWRAIGEKSRYRSFTPVSKAFPGPLQLWRNCGSLLTMQRFPSA